MSKLKVPSLQHLARIWRSDPVAIKKVLVGLTKHGPTFSYEPLHALVRDMLLFNTPYEQIVTGINRSIKRPDVRENFLSLLPLIREHFDGVPISFVHAVAPRYYPVGRGLMVPFNPPLVYGSEGKIYFPWFSFWRSNPLAEDQLSLFVTIVKEILLQDSDLEDAEFTILDFSAPHSREPRELTLINANHIAKLSEAKKSEMLSIFAEGFLLAKGDSSNVSAREDDRANDNQNKDDQQFNLDFPG